MFSDLFRGFLRQGKARVDSCSLKIQEMKKMVISDEISDFGNMNFRFWKYEFQICQFAYEEWRIESTRAYFPDGFYEARIGPKGAESHRSVKFGNRGSFWYARYSKDTYLCYLMCESNEYQMKICHMENISNLSCWKKNPRLFRFSFGEKWTQARNTLRRHTRWTFQVI